MKEAMPSFRRCKAKFKYKIIQKEKQIGEFLGMKVIISIISFSLNSLIKESLATLSAKDIKVPFIAYTLA